MLHHRDIIVAPATPTGGALTLIRLSGEGTIALCDKIFRGRAPLAKAKGFTLHYGDIVDGEQRVDDVLLTLFRAPHSYTGEESIELSCHGSSYIANRIIELCVAHGARMATAGEFTMRAFLNGKLDLMQAEAVADLISAESQSAHKIATRQMRGEYSSRLSELRKELVKLASLLELELDFSEEDVEFANRDTLRENMLRLSSEIELLKESFRLGNALKEGVMVAIVGEPNVGKSTLLNRLVGEERAMVSDIAGTTRDTIEEQIVIDGVKFRFIDTAGLHDSCDKLEIMGMERTRKAISKAHIILQIVESKCGIAESIELEKEQHLITIYNKIDTLSCEESERLSRELQGANKSLCISARSGQGVDALRKMLRSSVDTSALDMGGVVIANGRHAEALHLAQQSLTRALQGMTENLPTDLLAEEIRQVSYHIGCITGDISSDDILHSIFSTFCIGK